MIKRLVLLTALCVTAAQLHAAPTVTTYCVGSTQQLMQALGLANTTAFISDDVMTDIRLKASGTYELDDTINGYEFENLKLSGNYVNANCTTVDEAQSTFVTVLDAPVLHYLGDLELTQLHLLNGLELSADGAGKTRIHANRFQETDGSGLFIHPTSSASGTMEFVNNVVSVADGASLQNCTVTAAQSKTQLPSPTIAASFVNNTIASPGSGTYDAPGICIDHLQSVLLANNIIAGNLQPSVKDLNSAVPTSIGLVNNIFETPASTQSVGFDVNTQIIDFVFTAGAHGPLQIANDSPAVNAGWDGSNSYLDLLDIAGNPRHFAGTVVDIGAYEAPVGSASALVVTSNADSGAGTLRAAIVAANTQDNTPQTIRFDFGNAPVDCGTASTIELASALPTITDSLTIDGYSTDLSTFNTADAGFNAGLCVILKDKPGDGVTLTTGLKVPAGANGNGVNLTVKGLDLRGFTEAISLQGGANHVVQGNAIGIGQGSSVGRGVMVGPGVTGVVIGGYNTADRNHLGGASSIAVQVLGSTAFVINNLIGPGRSGGADLFARNAKGVELDGNQNTVVANTISGNISDAVLIQGNENFVSQNTIGLDDGASCTPACTGSQGNLRGVRVLGDDNVLERNVVAFSSQNAIAISNNATHNRLSKNRISSNGGLGIDLRADGVPDDPQTADLLESASVANGGQNFPELETASGAPKAAGPGVLATGSVSGVLLSKNGFYDIEIYANSDCDASGHGEGEELIGTGKVQITNSGMPFDGDAAFTIAVSSPSDLIGRQISATARAANGDTSEFSSCLAFVAANTAPVLMDRTVVLPLEALAGTQIQLNAIDDGLPMPPGALTYTLVTTQVPFSLSPAGVLATTQDDVFAGQASYWLSVKVEDGQYSDFATIKIVTADLFSNGFE